MDNFYSISPHLQNFRRGTIALFVPCEHFTAGYMYLVSPAVPTPLQTAEHACVSLWLTHRSLRNRRLSIHQELRHTTCRLLRYKNNFPDLQSVDKCPW